MTYVNLYYGEFENGAGDTIRVEIDEKLSSFYTEVFFQEQPLDDRVVLPGNELSKYSIGDTITVSGTSSNDGSYEISGILLQDGHTFISFTTSVTNETTSCTITVPDTITASQIQFADPPVVIESPVRERNDVIQSMGAQISLWQTTPFIYESLFAKHETRYRVTVKKNGNVYFQGFIDTSLFEQPLNKRKNVVTIPAADGLSSLKNKQFEDTYFESYKTLFTILKDALDKTGLEDLDIFINSDLTEVDNISINSTTTWYENAYVLTNLFKDMDLYDVVRYILVGCKIRQVDGAWKIDRIRDVGETSRAYVKYPSGSTTGKTSVTDESVATIGGDIRTHPVYVEGSRYRYKSGYKNIVYNLRQKLNDYLNSQDYSNANTVSSGTSDPSPALREVLIHDSLTTSVESDIDNIYTIKSEVDVSGGYGAATFSIDDGIYSKGKFTFEDWDEFQGGGTNETDQTLTVSFEVLLKEEDIVDAINNNGLADDGRIEPQIIWSLKIGSKWLYYTLDRWGTVIGATDSSDEITLSATKKYNYLEFQFAGDEEDGSATKIVDEFSDTEHNYSEWEVYENDPSLKVFRVNLSISCQDLLDNYLADLDEHQDFIFAIHHMPWSTPAQTIPDKPMKRVWFRDIKFSTSSNADFNEITGTIDEDFQNSLKLESFIFDTSNWNYLNTLVYDSSGEPFGLTKSWSDVGGTGHPFIERLIEENFQIYSKGRRYIEADIWFEGSDSNYNIKLNTIFKDTEIGTSDVLFTIASFRYNMREDFYRIYLDEWVDDEGIEIIDLGEWLP